MAIDLMWAAMNQQDIPPIPRFVAVVMANRVDADNVCWPAISTISRLTGYSRRSVQRAIRWLEDQGYLRSRQRSWDETAAYQFMVEKFSYHDAPKNPRERRPKDDFETGVQQTPHDEGRGAPQARRGAPQAQGGVQQTPNSLYDSLEDSLSLPDPKKQIEIVFVGAWKALSNAHAKIPAIRLFDDTRKGHLHKRLEEWADASSFEAWNDTLAELFERIHESHFLTGRNPKTPDFSAKLDWVLNKTNFRKIMEGNYDRNGNRPVQSTERNIHAAKADSAELLRRRREQRAGSAAQYS